MVHARALKLITQSDKKTDKKDAYKIARMLRLWKRKEIDLQMAFIPTREQCELKDICRYREEISKKIGDETRRIKSHMSRNCEYLPEYAENFQTQRARNYVRFNFQSDITLMNCDSSVTRYYKRKCSEMGTKKAIITSSRKMLSVIFAMLKSGSDFRLTA